jgi:hypothetical protein
MLEDLCHYIIWTWSNNHLHLAFFICLVWRGRHMSVMCHKGNESINK